LDKKYLKKNPPQVDIGGKHPITKEILNFFTPFVKKKWSPPFSDSNDIKVKFIVAQAIALLKETYLDYTIN